jgi:hypothetical protein
LTLAENRKSKLLLCKASDFGIIVTISNFNHACTAIRSTGTNVSKPNLTFSPSNPSRRAVARVLNPSPIPTACPFCGAVVTATNNDAIYGKSIGTWPWAYMCENKECHSYVGMHPLTNIPLGTLADTKTREARKLTKALFEPLHGKAGQMKRTEAYGWLANKLDIPVGECHFGWFDVAMCRRAYRILKEVPHA